MSVAAFRFFKIETNAAGSRRDVSVTELTDEQASQRVLRQQAVET